MDILEELFQGGISPVERKFNPNPRYHKLQDEITRRGENLTRDLPPEKLEALEKIRDNIHEQQMLVEQDAFACGFRLGAQLMLAAVQPWNGEET